MNGDYTQVSGRYQTTLLASESNVTGNVTVNSSAFWRLSGGNNELLTLVFYSFLAVFGSTVNIFTISALIVQQSLCRKGNVFLANLALANLVVTTLSFPATAVAILASNQAGACYWQCYGALLCFITSAINFLFIAAENYLRTCRRDGELYGICCGVRAVAVIAFISWVVAVLWIVFVAHRRTGPDICTREYHRSDGELFLVFLLPLGLAGAIFVKNAIDQRYYQSNPSLKYCQEAREQTSQRHLFRSNVIAFIFFLCFWLPFVFVWSLAPPYVQRQSLESLMSFGQTYSCVCALVYACTNDAFRSAFMYLTRYLCCKSHAEVSRVQPEKPRGSSVRVHIGMETRMCDGRRLQLSTLLGTNSQRSRRAEDYL